MKFQGVKSIASNALYLASSHGLTGLIRGIYAIFLARMLGPEVYGMFNYGMSWYLAFLPLSMLGLDAILARETGRRHANSTKIMAFILALRSIVALVISLLCALSAWILEDKAAVQYLLLIFSFALFGRALALFSQSVFSAYEQSKYAFQQDMIFRLLEIMTGITVLLLSIRFAFNTLYAIAAVHAIAWWLQGLRGLALVRRHLYPVKPEWDIPAMTRLLKQGIPIGLATLFLTWLQQGPLVLYRYQGGLEESLGCLALAMQALYLLSGIPGALGRAALPVLSRAVDREDGKDKIFIEAMVRIGLLLGAAAGITGLALGPWIIPLIFGEKYIQTGTLIGPILWLLSPLIIALILQQVFVAHGRFITTVIAASIGALAFTITAPLLITSHDTLGVILASGAGMTVWAAILIANLFAFTQINTALVLLRPSLVIIISFTLFLWSETFGPWISLPLALFAMAVAVVLCGVLSPSEKQLIASFLRKRKT